MFTIQGVRIFKTLKMAAHEVGRLQSNFEMVGIKVFIAVQTFKRIA